jgi:hypothetical protein
MRIDDLQIADIMKVVTILYKMPAWAFSKPAKPIEVGFW